MAEPGTSPVGRHASPHRAMATSGPSTEDGAPAARVLIVDDFAPLRTLCTTVLERQGYEALAAASADAALEIIAGNTAPSVVVTDLNMPGATSGLQLVDHLQSNYPSIGIVVMTGDVIGDVVGGIETNQRVMILKKPFDNGTLLSTVACLVGA